MKKLLHEMRTTIDADELLKVIQQGKLHRETIGGEHDGQEIKLTFTLHVGNQVHLVVRWFEWDHGGLAEGKNAS